MNKKLIALLTLTLAVCGTSFGQAKIGTVDLNRIFEAYYKSQEARARVGDSENAYKKERQVKLEDRQKLIDEINKLREDAQNNALSPEVRESKKKAFAEKAKEIQMREQEIVQFDQQRRGQIQGDMLRMRNSIVEEITKVVKDYAAKNQFTFVFDKTGQSTALAPLVIYSQDALDFSDEIIKTLNAGKGTAAAAPKPAAPAPPK